MFKKFRAEISFKDIEQLKKRIDFCSKNNILSINIPCKGVIKKDFLLEIVDFIGNNYSNLNVIYHYSLYHQYYKNKKKSYECFLDFIDKCNSFRNKEILLVSGSKKRIGFDVIDLLNEMKYELNPNIKFGIAFNPYFSFIEDIKEERKRLLDKLSSGLISSIWLQLGSDVKLLDKSVIFLKENIRRIYHNKNRDVKLYGSLFVPSKQSLARFKFRPWKGVFFSNQYLNSVEKANFITNDILKIYAKNDIQLLIESECSSNQQLINTKSILSQ